MLSSDSSLLEEEVELVGNYGIWTLEFNESYTSSDSEANIVLISLEGEMTHLT